MSQAKGSPRVPSRAPTEPQAQSPSPEGDVGDVGDDSDRRRAPRVLVDFEVDYASEDNYLFAYITDISATGIFVRTTSPEPPGTHLNLRFSPPPDPDIDDRPLEVEGEVIWWNPFRPGKPDNLHPGMGVRFAGLDDHQRMRIVDLVGRIAYLT